MLVNVRVREIKIILPKKRKQKVLTLQGLHSLRGPHDLQILRFGMTGFCKTNQIYEVLVYKTKRLTSTGKHSRLENDKICYLERIAPLSDVIKKATPVT